MMMRYFLKLSFLGTHYHGWQIQKNALSVQQVLDKCLSEILNTKIHCLGCGRTDTGAHATEFYAQFDAPAGKAWAETFIRTLNSILPDDIRTYEFLPVHQDANARFDALSRTYQYHINQKPSCEFVNRSLYYYTPLNLELLNTAANILLEYDDFTSFCKVHTQVKTKTCKISEALWKKSNDTVVFTITADRFLRGMVRTIVGTSFELNRGKININDFRNIIECRDRTRAGPAVDACGLYLTKICYPEAVFLKRY